MGTESENNGVLKEGFLVKRVRERLKTFYSYPYGKLIPNCSWIINTIMFFFRAMWFKTGKFVGLYLNRTNFCIINMKAANGIRVIEGRYR